MKNVVGLWIDHRKTSIVFIADDKEESKVIESNVEKHGGRSEGGRSTTSYEAQLVPADDSREKDFTGHLAHYYDEVISCIHDAEKIFIFGPGEAKGELKKRIEQTGLAGRVVRIETIDKMTEPQIAAKVRNYFKENKDSNRRKSYG
jgi:hypothetical protein